MDEAPATRQYIFSGLFLMIVGWGGLALLIFVLNVHPYVWARWSFFALWFIALSGTALPIVYFLNLRFPSDPRAEPNVIVRQALWVGVYGATIAWLQLGQLVTLWVLAGLGAGLVAIEYVIRSRERARWRPPQNTDEEPMLDAHYLDPSGEQAAETDEPTQ
jgi:hypothetical protein